MESDQFRGNFIFNYTARFPGLHPTRISCFLSNEWLKYTFVKKIGNNSKKIALITIILYFDCNTKSPQNC